MDPYPSNSLTLRTDNLKIDFFTGIISYLKGRLLSNLLVKNGKNIRIGKGVVFMGNVVLEDDVVIGDGVFLENSVIGKGTLVKSGARVVNSKIGNHCTVDGEIDNSQVGNAVVLERRTYVRNGEIGDNSRIGFGVCIGHPRKRILVGSDVVVAHKAWIMANVGNHCFVGGCQILKTSMRDNTIISNVGGKQRITQNADWMS